MKGLELLRFVYEHVRNIVGYFVFQPAFFADKLAGFFVVNQTALAFGAGYDIKQFFGKHINKSQTKLKKLVMGGAVLSCKHSCYQHFLTFFREDNLYLNTIYLGI